ncbi:MAG: sensor histidine kinase [Propioniciclava sp.]
MTGEPPPPWWQTLLVILGCALGGILVWSLVHFAVPQEWTAGAGADALVLVDLVLGGLSLPLVGVAHRRRSLVAICCLILISGVSGFATVGAGYASVIATIRFPWRKVGVLALMWVISGVLGTWITNAGRSEPVGLIEAALYGALMWGLTVLIGWGARSRRATMIAHQREAAATIREQQALLRERDAQLARTQAAERSRIAREVHDALSHELSVIAMHAGAMEYRDDLTSHQLRDTAATVAAAARRAGTELRRVITTLRDDTSAEAPADLSDLPELVTELATSGSTVNLRIDPRLPLPELPISASQQLLRVAREALNNAVRHAPGAPVTLTLSGGPAAGLQLECRNELRTSIGAADARGSGAGHVGMTEVARLLGGTLTTGEVGNHYRTRLEVPWPG